MTPLEALSSHAPAVVVGAVLCLIVLSARIPSAAAQWQRLPAWARPLVPAVLALLSGVGEALIQGQPWQAAIVAQLALALPAIGYALPSPTAHLDQVILPDSPAVRLITREPVVSIKVTDADDLAGQVLKNLDRDTTPTAPPGG